MTGAMVVATRAQPRCSQRRFMGFVRTRRGKSSSDFANSIKSVRHKIRGKNGRGNPTKFSQTEEKQINQAILKMARNAVKK